VKGSAVMWPSWRLVFALLIVFTLPPVSADEITLEPSQDAFVCDCVPGATNPMLGDQYLAQGRYSACYNRTFIQWDLTGIPAGSDIVSAEFRIYCADFYGSVSGQMVYYMVIEDWDEGSVTFLNRPDHTAAGAVIETTWPASSSWRTVDVTGFVTDWFEGTANNFGMLCHSEGCTSTSDCAYYSSRVSAAAYRPRLVVTYTAPGALDTQTWGGLKTV